MDNANLPNPTNPDPAPITQSLPIKSSYLVLTCKTEKVRRVTFNFFMTKFCKRAKLPTGEHLDSIYAKLNAFQVKPANAAIEESKKLSAPTIGNFLQTATEAGVTFRVLNAENENALKATLQREYDDEKAKKEQSALAQIEVEITKPPEEATAAAMVTSEEKPNG
jgi:hypothetical protein